MIVRFFSDNVFITSICLGQVTYISQWKNEFAFCQPWKIKLKNNDRGSNIKTFYVVRDILLPQENYSIISTSVANSFFFSSHHFQFHLLLCPKDHLSGTYYLNDLSLKKYKLSGRSLKLAFVFFQDPHHGFSLVSQPR